MWLSALSRALSTQLSGSASEYVKCSCLALKFALILSMCVSKTQFWFTIVTLRRWQLTRWTDDTHCKRRIVSLCVFSNLFFFFTRMNNDVLENTLLKLLTQRRSGTHPQVVPLVQKIISLWLWIAKVFPYCCWRVWSGDACDSVTASMNAWRLDSSTTLHESRLDFWLAVMYVQTTCSERYAASSTCKVILDAAKFMSQCPLSRTDELWFRHMWSGSCCDDNLFDFSVLRENLYHVCLGVTDVWFSSSDIRDTDNSHIQHLFLIYSSFLTHEKILILDSFVFLCPDLHWSDERYWNMNFHPLSAAKINTLTNAHTKIDKLSLKSK